MSTINQEVLANQNHEMFVKKAKNNLKLSFHLKDYKPDTTEYWFQMMMLLESKQDEDQIKEKYADVFKSPYFADFMKDWVLKTDLPESVTGDPFVKNTLQEGNSLEKYLTDIAFRIGVLGNDVGILKHEDVYDLKETVEIQKEEILNLQTIICTLDDSSKRLQEVAFPPTTPKKPTAKVGWLDRPVSQFSKRTGEFIRNWESPRQAEAVLGKLNAHSVVEQLKRGSGSSGGYIWRVGHYTEEA
jgi:hypothetical protein